MCETGPDVPQPTGGPGPRPEPHPCRSRGRSPRWTVAASGSRPVASAVVFVVDGLGARNLAARAGHARFLVANAVAKKDVARTRLPLDDGRGAHLACSRASTRASTESSATACASPARMTLRTSSRAGRPTDSIRAPGSEPSRSSSASPPRDARASWCPARSSTGRASRRRSCAARPSSPPPTRPTVRRLAADLVARHPGALVYLYAPELDGIAHQRGWESDEWAHALETVDAAARSLASRAARRTPGALVTADHGMVDVPRHRQLLARRRGRPRRRRAGHRRGAAHAAPLRRGRAADAVLDGVARVGVGALLGHLARRGDRGRALRPGRRRGARPDRRRPRRCAHAGSPTTTIAWPTRRRRRWSASTDR